MPFEAVWSLTWVGPVVDKRTCGMWYTPHTARMCDRTGRTTVTTSHRPFQRSAKFVIISRSLNRIRRRLFSFENERIVFVNRPKQTFPRTNVSTRANCRPPILYAAQNDYKLKIGTRVLHRPSFTDLRDLYRTRAVLELELW